MGVLRQWATYGAVGAIRKPQLQPAAAVRNLAAVKCIGPGHRRAISMPPNRTVGWVAPDRSPDLSGRDQVRFAHWLICMVAGSRAGVRGFPVRFHFPLGVVVEQN